MASASRDRLVHVFDAAGVQATQHASTLALLSKADLLTAGPAFGVVTTLADHAASVTAVRFSRDGSQLVSAAADGAIVFSKVRAGAAAVTTSTAAGVGGGSGGCVISRVKAVKQTSGAVYDMAIDPTNNSLVAAGQDRYGVMVNMWHSKQCCCGIGVCTFGHSGLAS